MSPSNAAQSDRRFAADSLLLIGANSLAGLLYLLVHIVLGRRLEGVDYAALVSLLGLLNVLSVGANSLQVAMARHAAGLDGEARPWIALCRQVAQRALPWAAAALGLWCALAVPLRRVFEAPSAVALVLLGLLAALQLLQPLVQGLLQGLRLFPWIAASALSGAGVRLLGALALVGLGWGFGRPTTGPDHPVTWALVAFLAGALVALAVAAWPVARRLLGSASATMDSAAGSEETVDLEPSPTTGPLPWFRYLAWVLAGQVALFTLMNADLILAPRLLDGETLGAYGKAAMLARTVVFMPLPVVIAMFPRAVASAHRGLLTKPLAFVLLTSTAAALVLSRWPGLFLGWMYGSTEALAAPLAARYVWAVIPLALLEVVIPYLWARDRLGAAVTAAVPAALYVAALALADGRPFAMIQSLGVAGLVTLAWLVLAVLPSRRGSALGSAP